MPRKTALHGIDFGSMRDEQSDDTASEESADSDR